MANRLENLQRIGVFYDGNYFLKVNNFYNYEHRRRARIDISGFHEFIREEISKLTNTDRRNCQIVDAHYFRGRLPAAKIEDPNQIYNDRVFDDILMYKNVTSHYLPVRHDQQGMTQEKGIDVWLALEAYELAIYKQFDILVLVACDGDYVPLVRKLNTLGTRVMLISWDFSYFDKLGRECVTRTSQQLLEEVSYMIPMHQLVDDRVRQNDPIINNIFRQSKKQVINDTLRLIGNQETPDHASEEYNSTILSLKEGYGFIRDDEKNNVFFHSKAVQNADFRDLWEGMKVRYVCLKDNDKFVAEKVWIVR
ncbi:MAG: NYN domain-containing protein [Clostridiales bacterium]|jgi:cold shock CspA family protein/uncharacterized LabA/DUF88 family protein|nr:NYN domain-containing protein [Clostridiales bacterium]MDR2713751.1 NYN domain-containing protein [Clostridiales bacterium]